MHIRLETTVSGKTLAELTVEATKVWREFNEDPIAELPWNAELNVEETLVDSTLDGEVTRRLYSAQVRVTSESQAAYVTPAPSTT